MAQFLYSKETIHWAVIVSNLHTVNDIAMFSFVAALHDTEYRAWWAVAKQCKAVTKRVKAESSIPIRCSIEIMKLKIDNIGTVNKTRIACSS